MKVGSLGFNEAPLHLGKLRSNRTVEYRAPHLDNNPSNEALVRFNVQVDLLSRYPRQSFGQPVHFFFRNRCNRRHAGRDYPFALIDELQVVFNNLVEEADSIALQHYAQEIGCNRVRGIPRQQLIQDPFLGIFRNLRSIESFQELWAGQENFTPGLEILRDFFLDLLFEYDVGQRSGVARQDS